MQIKILIDKNKKVIGYCDYGDMDGAINVDITDDIALDALMTDYYYIDDKLQRLTRDDLVLQGVEVDLKEGEIIQDKKIVKIAKLSNLIQPIWTNNEWQEGYTKDDFFYDIDRTKAYVLTTGYMWQGHKQKCRDKDVAFLESVISTQKDYKADFNEDLIVKWSFSDDDRGVPLTLADTKSLRNAGQIFMQKVFAVEELLKSGAVREVNFDIYSKMLDSVG